MAKILKCNECGSIIEVLIKGDEDTCNSHMSEIPVQTEGEKAPKHKPVVEIDGDNVVVKVGEVQHPSDDDHYIQIITVTVGNEIYTKQLQAGDVPEANFIIASEKTEANDVIAKAYCNLHGLWSSE